MIAEGLDVDARGRDGGDLLKWSLVWLCERTRIGDSVVHVRTTSAGMMATATSVFEYVHRDYLGLVEGVTNEAGWWCWATTGTGSGATTTELRS